MPRHRGAALRGDGLRPARRQPRLWEQLPAVLHGQPVPVPAALQHADGRAQLPYGQPSVLNGFDPRGVSLCCGSSFPQFFTDNQFQFQQHFNMLMGAHSFRTGIEYRRTRNGSVFATTKNGFILPHGVEELLTDGFFGDEADLALFGEPTFGAFTQALVTIDPRNGNQPEYYRGYRANEWAAYFQDDWKVRRNLTFNVGLRWEYFGPPHNFRSGLDSNFFFGPPTTPVSPTSTNVFFPRNNPLTAEVATGGLQQRGNEIWRSEEHTTQTH